MTYVVVVEVELCNAAAVAAYIPSPPIEAPTRAAEAMVGKVLPLKAPIKLPDVPVAEEITLGFELLPGE